MRTLTDSELDAVSGGAFSLTNVQALQNTAVGEGDTASASAVLGQNGGAGTNTAVFFGTAAVSAGAFGGTLEIN